MDFGKVPYQWQLDKISFDLPQEDERSSNLLLESRKKVALHSNPKVYIGCPIWGKKEWVGTVYPPKTSQRDFLKYYSQQLNTIELNTTFYRIPDVVTVERWRDLVPSGFKFSPKIFQEISQFEILPNIPNLVHRFCNSVLHFDDHLGVSFLQLPPSFSPQKILILKRFFRLLPQGFQLAVEFRHPDWFHTGRLIDPAFELLAENGISTVITDVAGRRDVLHQSLTTRVAMIRFVGNALHPTDHQRIQTWIDRLGSWFAKGVEQVYFFVHEPEEVGTLELVDSLVDQLNKKFGLGLKSWDPSLAHPQVSFFC